MNITLHIVPSLLFSKLWIFRQEQRAIIIVMYIGALMRSGAGLPLTCCQSIRLNINATKFLGLI